MDILEQLILHEGLRLYAYDDATGKPIKAGSTLIGHPTIGVGRNLAGRGITQMEAMILLKEDIFECTKELKKTYPWFSSLSDVRQRVLIDMAFNLGMKGLGSFKMTLRLIEQGKYEEAAEQMLRSKWSAQVGKRAQRLSYMMQYNKEM